ncbi:MAG: DUF4360 domain-containing protein [Devosia sp.]
MNIKSLFCCLALTVGLSTAALAQEGCPQGTFSVVNSPDGTSLSILFDAFSVSSGGSSGAGIKQKTCNLQVPLRLPEGYSLGVYRVDYRGYAYLSRKETSELTVDYHLGPRNKGRRFHRKTKGKYDGEFLFTENIGAGLMKRVGCGEAAVLNVSVKLALAASGEGEAMATLDSADGAPKGGLIYYFDTKKCRP